MIDTKALREKVLDLAIRGKLVPQDPTDEPASVLLERIREQKKQMVKEGKLKAKDIKDDSIIFVGDDNLHYEKFADGTIKCIEDEIPFDLPDGWAWCRLKDLFNVCSAKRVLQSEWQKEGIPFYRAREIVKLSNNGYVDNDLFISLEHYKALKQAYGVPQVGDLMVTGVGTIGKVYIVKENDTFYYKDASVLCFENRYKAIESEYARIMIDSPLLQEQIHSKTYGNTVDTITISTANAYLCILPPISEQKKIIETVKNILKITAIIEDGYDGLQSSITQVKSKILDLAIRGMLVPQDPDDEPASILLERIRAEKEELIKQGKIKRDKKESVIFKGEDNSYYRLTADKKRFDAEIPFEIPKNWCWTTLPSVASVELGKTLDKAKNTGSYHPYLRSVNVQWGYIDLSDLNEMKFEEHEIDKYSIKRNDLLICEGGDVGRCCIWEINDTFLYQNALHRVRFYADLEPRFYLYVMMLYESLGILKNISTGVTIKHLTGNVLSAMPVPLPPLSEQKRIVEAIEVVFAQLDEITSSIS